MKAWQAARTIHAKALGWDRAAGRPVQPPVVTRGAEGRHVGRGQRVQTCKPAGDNQISVKRADTLDQPEVPMQQPTTQPSVPGTFLE